ncbi:MAG: GNAT family N-acetyltransferase [Bacteroidetes bacterium]|nr:GNAT family N-acetyltransferase [Fibrella sp.]
MPVQFTTATTPADLQGILTLQAANQKAALSADYQKEQGFVTLTHTPDMLHQMSEAAPQIIAKDGNTVVGYALTLLPSVKDVVPALEPLFDQFDQVTYDGKCISEYPYYMMGQICVDEAYRGQGLFDGLYATHRQRFAGQYELLVTDIAIRNTRSRRAHQRVGFQETQTFEDSLDRWVVVVWDWRTN